MPRFAVVLGAILALALAPPEWLDRGPNLCLWRHLFHLAACPSCGSTRALAACFHGRFHQALGYNRNVLVTAPALLGLAVQDAAALLAGLRRRFGRRPPLV